MRERIFREVLKVFTAAGNCIGFRSVNFQTFDLFIMSYDII